MNESSPWMRRGGVWATPGFRSDDHLGLEDISVAGKLFVSDEADYVTGQVLTVSGGWMP